MTETTALVPTADGALASGIGVEKLISSFLSGRSPNTLRSYNIALLDFAKFAQTESIEAASRKLLGLHPGQANALVLDYQNHLGQRKLSPNTVNHHVAAIRSLVKLARMLGMITWTVEVENVDVRAYRDTRGPGKEGVQRMLKLLEAQDTPKAKRDAALVHLLFDRGLRRGEVAAMDLADVDFAENRVRIIGKGRTQSEWLTIPTPTLKALEAWLEQRGREAGPLFHNLDAVMDKGRLSADAIYWMVRELGEQAGLGHVRPHGLRHAAITHALDKTNGNVRAAAKFARHKQLDTTLIYDDARQDIGGEVAKLISD